MSMVDERVTGQDAEVARVLDDVRQRVRKRQTPGVLTASDKAAAELEAAMQDVNLSAKVNNHLPLLWEDMLFGRLRAYAQRLVRRLLRWYINPIVDQQNLFNASAARAMGLLLAENVHLRSQCADLESRVAELEAVVAKQ